MWASSGVVPKTGARLVMLVVMTSSIKAMIVQRITKRSTPIDANCNQPRHHPFPQQRGKRTDDDDPEKDHSIRH